MRTFQKGNAGVLARTERIPQQVWGCAEALLQKHRAEVWQIASPLDFLLMTSAHPWTICLAAFQAGANERSSAVYGAHIKLLQNGLQAGERQALAAGAPERPGAQRLGQLGQPGSFHKVRGNAGAQKVCRLGQPLACQG